MSGAITMSNKAWLLIMFRSVRIRRGRTNSLMPSTVSAMSEENACIQKVVNKPGRTVQNHLRATEGNYGHRSDDCPLTNNNSNSKVPVSNFVKTELEAQSKGQTAGYTPRCAVSIGATFTERNSGFMSVSIRYRGT